MTAQFAHVPSKDQDELRAAGASSERVWTLKELEILHEICKPTVVIVSSVYDSPHRYVRFSVCLTADAKPFD